VFSASLLRLQAVDTGGYLKQWSKTDRFAAIICFWRIVINSIPTKAILKYVGVWFIHARAFAWLDLYFHIGVVQFSLGIKSDRIQSYPSLQHSSAPSPQIFKANVLK